MPLRTTYLALLAAAALGGCTDQPAAPPPTTQTTAPAAAPGRPAAAGTMRYAGEYAWHEAENKEVGGTLTVYPESDSTILFSLQASSGAPSYLLANAFGRARLRGATATYFGKAPADTYGCKLRIRFSPTAAQVSLVNTKANDCFFGGSFIPDGTYQRTSRTVPQQVVDDAGDTLRFAHLPPESLQDSH